MNKIFKTWILLFIAAGVLISGCSSRSMVANNWPGISVSGDTAYLAYGNSVYAIRTADGGLIWRFPEKPSNKLSFFASPAVDDDQIIVGDFTNSLYGIDIKTGAQKWVFVESKNRYIAEALVENGKIYAPSADSTLYALDSQHNIIWKFETGQALWAKPVSDGELIYQASMDHNLYAIKPDTGEEVWKVDLGGAAGYSPALNGEGKLFIGTLANELIALNKTNGKVEWRFTTEGAVWSTPLLHNNILYFGDISGSFYSLDALTGSLIWTIKNEGGIVGSPVNTPEGVIYGTEAGEIIAVKFDGEKIWTKMEAGEIYSPPSLVGDKVLVAITKGDELLKAYSLTGAVLWSFKIPE